MMEKKTNQGTHNLLEFRMFIKSFHLIETWQEEDVNVYLR